MSELRIGCVSFLNSRPLVHGLDQASGVKVMYSVPSGLMDLLIGDECDLALLPTIDYQCAEDLTIVPASCIAADGHVQTVRLFSRVPFGKIQRLTADTDSHTSVALCHIILRHVYGIDPVFAHGETDACLLIGDKVVCNAPQAHPHELDLAEAWKQWTGLPFVFATWMTRHPERCAGAMKVLGDALKRGMASIDEIVRCYGVPRGWPADVAREYLTRLLHFDISLEKDSPQRQAIERFHRLAYEMRLIPRCRELVIARP